MAFTVHDGALPVASPSRPAESVDRQKVALWVGLVVLPWAVIIAAGRLVIATLG